MCRSAARSSGARVLDVGCGGGLLAETLARAGAQVTAIDLAPSMVETARLHALDSGLTIDYRVEAAEQLLNELTLANSTWSPAWRCSSTFPIRPRPIAVLGKLVRPGGHLFVSTINRNFKSFAAGHRRRRICREPGAARHA